MSSPDLAARYGAPAPWRRRALQAASVLVVLGAAAWLVWALFGHTSPAVSSELETFAVEDQHTVSAAVVITLRDDDVEAECLLTAFAEDHTTVGELSFTPDPAKGKRQVVEVRTERLATSLELAGCRAEGQTRYR